MSEKLYSIPEVAHMVQSAYEWEEFREVSEEVVSDWIASMYGNTWTQYFTLEEAQEIVNVARNNGWNFY